MAHPGRDGEDQQRAVVRFLGRDRTEMADLGGVENPHLHVRHSGRGRQAGDVPIHPALPHGGAEGSVQDHVNVVDRGGARPGRQPLGVHGIQAGGLETAQPEPPGGRDQVDAAQLPVPNPLGLSSAARALRGCQTPARYLSTLAAGP